MTDTPTPLSVNAAAKALNMAKASLQLAIRDGRVAAALVYVNGKPKIRDLELARRELAESTKAEYRPLSGPGAADDGAPSALAEARARRETALAGLAELELAKQRGEVVLVRGVEAKIVDVFTHCKTRLLGLPSRARQQLPHLTVADVATLDDLVHQALEELADGIEKGGAL